MKTKYLLLSLALLLGLCLFIQKPASPKSAPPSEEEKQLKFNYLLSHRLQSPLNSLLYPVFIFRDPVVTALKLNGTWRASGTALVKDGKPLWIISAAHCFTEDGTYYVTVVTPELTQSVWGIEKVNPPIGSNDIVMARVGVPTKIKGIKSTLQSLYFDRRAEIRSIAVKESAQSLITGEKYHIIGSVTFPGEQPLYLLNYSCTRAESGSGFLHGDEILVLSQFMVLDTKTQKELGVKPRDGFYTLLTGAKVKWP